MRLLSVTDDGLLPPSPPATTTETTTHPPYLVGEGGGRIRMQRPALSFLSIECLLFIIVFHSFQSIWVS